MSFLALRPNTGESVVPEEVENGVSLECPKCGEEVRGRGPSKDGRARHFYHKDRSGCPGGESALHRKQKSLVASALRARLSNYDRISLEERIDVSGTQTSVEYRQADVLLEFGDHNQHFGKGIAVEVQYRNWNKHVTATTFDYLVNGYSIIWAKQDDFADRRFKLDPILLQFDDRDTTYRVGATSPASLCPLNPPDFTGTGYYFDERVGGPSDPTMRATDDCDHQWQEQIPDRYQCLKCQAKLATRAYLQFDPENPEGDDIGYIISLDPDTLFEAMTKFEPRGVLLEIHGEERPCERCGTEFMFFIGWDGVNLYSPRLLYKHVSDKEYCSVYQTGSEPKRACPKCNWIHEFGFDDSTDLFYTTPIIDRIWVPKEFCRI